ncbi:MAG: hypothetical protein JW709_07250 [Sedimentisphaerales bacterium]|nr:hypothetical protein [Sedimentisphaerales bacterium]
MSDIYYIDHNVFVNLVEYRCGVTKKVRDNLLRLTDKGIIKLAISGELLQETLQVLYTSDVPQLKDRLIFLKELGSYIQITKDHGAIFKDDIISFADTGKPSLPYLPNSEEIIQQFMGDLSNEDINWINDEVKNWKDDFYKEMFPPINEWAKGVEGWDNPSWNDYWKEGQFVEFLGERWAKEYGILERCLDRGLDQLKTIPSILMATGYWAWNLYRIATCNAKVKSSSSFDYTHAIIGAAVGSIVTNDKDLIRAFADIPDHTTHVLPFKEWLRKLES